MTFNKSDICIIKNKQTNSTIDVAQYCGIYQVEGDPYHIFINPDRNILYRNIILLPVSYPYENLFEEN